jgi:putative FmdB family regulatory protein
MEIINRCKIWEVIMPKYEYKCNKCGEKSELRLSFFHKKEEVKCPKCGSDDMERIFSAPFTKGGGGCDSCSSGGFS